MSELDFCPWLYWSQATDEERERQVAFQTSLPGLTKAGERSYISPLAAIYQANVTVGDESYIAAHVYVTGEVMLGDNTTLNPYAVVRGPVRLGCGVRVGAHASLVAVNHSIEPDRPVFRQGVFAKGITVGDDVWIGSNAVVLDGVKIGDHSVIGAGAVVTKDVPPWSVMVGNPARRIRDRRDRTRPSSVVKQLEGFAAQARAQALAVLDRYWAGDTFVSQPGAAPTVRATCDAIEVADLLLGGPPPHASDWTQRLTRLQDPVTGHIPDYGEDQPTLDSDLSYHMLSVGYALDLLGAALPHPIEAANIDSARLVSSLDNLPWEDRAWHAGAWVDTFGTALYWNNGPLETLFGWLLTRQDPWTGLWGTPTAREGWRQPVNGYYRLTRGTFAQFGVPVPRPETTIDTVLAHTRDTRFFGDGRGTACDVLDVIHPLWLCGAQTGHRRAEAQAWARERLPLALSCWQPHAGFGFSPTEPSSLQGTEMWLAILWLLADVLGESEALGYRPRGVHRPEPRTSR